VGKRPSLLKALWRAFGLEVMVGGFWKLCWSVFVIVGEWAAICELCWPA